MAVEKESRETVTMKWIDAAYMLKGKRNVQYRIWQWWHRDSEKVVQLTVENITVEVE